MLFGFSTCGQFNQTMLWQLVLCKTQSLESDVDFDTIISTNDIQFKL